jgi:nitroreductase/NAD-dependent dihydropyrimidine dehydrogenase PreA subunit
MQHLKIDLGICNGCGYCATDCPMGIIRMNEAGLAECVEANAEVCIYCGHCVAVCPVRAICLNEIQDEEKLEWIREYGIVPFSLRPEDCQKSQSGNAPGLDKVKSLIRSRRITRTYRPQLVDRKTLVEIFEVLEYAPSGHNTRGYQILVVEGRRKLEELTDRTCACFKEMLAEGKLSRFDTEVFKRIIAAWGEEKVDRIFRTAQQAIVVHCSSGIVPAEPAVQTLLTYFEVLASAAGLGTAWAGYFMVAARKDPVIRELLGVPTSHTIHGAMMVGYPGCTYQIIPRRPHLSLSWKQ